MNIELTNEELKWLEKLLINIDFEIGIATRESDVNGGNVDILVAMEDERLMVGSILSKLKKQDGKRTNSD